jgi:hypothetical protein
LLLIRRGFDGRVREQDVIHGFLSCFVGTPPHWSVRPGG